MPLGEAMFSSGDLMRRLRDMERRIDELSTARRLEAATIGEGGLRVAEGGDITVDGGNLVLRSGGGLVLEEGARFSIPWGGIVGGTGRLGGPNNSSGSLVLLGPNGEDVLATIDNEGIEASTVEAGAADLGALVVAGDVEVGGAFAPVEGVGPQVDDLHPASDPPRAYESGTTAFDCTTGAGWPATGAAFSVVTSPAQGRGMQFVMPSTTGAWWQVRAALDGATWSAWQTFAMPGAGTPAAGTTTSTWSSTWSGSWRTVYNAWRDGASDVYQGSNGGYGNHRGLWGFDDASIRATLAGRTIGSVRVRVSRSSGGGVYAAQTPTWWTHNYANEPTSGQPSLSGGVDAGSFARGTTGWATLPDSYGNDLRDNVAKGIALYVADGDPYLIFEPTATLEVVHS